MPGPVACMTFLLFSSAVATGALADEPNRFEITPYAGYRVGGQFEDAVSEEDRDVAEDGSFGLILAWTESPGRQYELFYGRQQTEIEGPEPLDLDIDYLHVGGSLYWPRERWSSFFSGGLGATRFSPGPSGIDDETRFSLSLGGGVRVALSDRVGLRFEARGFLTLINSETEIFCISEGGDARCAIRGSGDTFLQFEALAGITFGF